MFAGRRVEKRYLALCAGEPSPGGALTVEAPLGQQGRRAVVAGGGGREARTRAWTVAVGRDASLWVVAPEGGRFHQVRAHLASAGHPLVGDWRYGQPADLCLGLHALGLRFTHPFTGAPVLVVAPPQPLFQRLANRHGLPPDWQERALDALRWETPS
jgi:23S rRNA-/tRNA-specific pseudouridylate synthase